jgi:hypothetical protein
MIALGASIILLIVGIAMIIVGKKANIDVNVDKALYIVGIILFIIGLIFLALNLVGITI